MHKLKMDSIRWKCAFRLRDEIKRNAGADQHKNYPMLRVCVCVCKPGERMVGHAESEHKRNEKKGYRSKSGTK